MSERIRLLLVAALLAPAPARAQDVDSLRARIDSLQAEFRAQARYSRAQSDARLRARAAEVAEPLDTAAVGPFRVVARERELALALSHFQDAWARISASLGDVAPNVTPHTFLVSVTTPVPLFATMRARHQDRVFLRRWRFGAVQPDAASVAIGRALSPLVPPALRLWSGGDYYRAPTRWEAVYRELATSSALPARRCLDGDLAACIDALVLDPERAAPERWYSPARLRSLALDRTRFMRLPDRDACEAGDDAACRRLLPPAEVPPPLSRAARHALVQLALDRGGPGAFARLARDPAASLPAQLAAAAALPLEELVREWHARTVRAQPHAHAGLGITLAATLVWSLLFVWLATRSTRCRTG